MAGASWNRANTVGFILIITYLFYSFVCSNLHLLLWLDNFVNQPASTAGWPLHLLHLHIPSTSASIPLLHIRLCICKFPPHRPLHLFCLYPQILLFIPDISLLKRRAWGDWIETEQWSMNRRVESRSWLKSYLWLLAGSNFLKSDHQNKQPVNKNIWFLDTQSTLAARAVLIAWLWALYGKLIRKGKQSIQLKKKWEDFFVVDCVTQFSMGHASSDATQK